jgi:ribosomal-protein-alanine N-acetyltransferase
VRERGDPLIETERLKLLPFAQLQATQLHTLWTQPEVRRYLWDDEIISDTRTAEILQRNDELFAREGFGLWSISQRAARELCGFGGYWYFREPSELELILGLAAEYWHRGIATEAGRALIEYGFDVLGFSEIRASCDGANQRSVSLMQRLGMHYEKRISVAGIDTVFYRIQR